MRRRLLLSLCLLLFAARTFAADTPNILYILSDDQAWTDYGFMGHDAIKTPHLDKLASQSALFPRSYVPMSLCRPSLATLITGLYPHQHLISGNDPVFQSPQGRKNKYESLDYLRLNQDLIAHIEAVPTLPRLLAGKGYVSFQSGKWWEGTPARGGFTAGMTHGDPARGGRHGDAGLDIGRKTMQPVFDFIDQAADKPWLVWYAPMMPHSAHNPPDRILKKYVAPGRPEEIAKYYAMCEWFDETIGELLGHLDQKGLADNTLVVYVTDNGWLQDPDSPQYAPKSKRSPYDGGLRTPVMLRWPGHIQPARYDNTLVSTIDLVPTMLAAAGIKPTKEMQGLNLLDVCKHGGQTDRDAVFGAIYAHDIADVNDPEKSLEYRWCVQGNWKLILPAGQGGAPELYDLSSDPTETKNLAAAHVDVVRKLTARIDKVVPKT